MVSTYCFRKHLCFWKYILYMIWFFTIKFGKWIFWKLLLCSRNILNNCDKALWNLFSGACKPVKICAMYICYLLLPVNKKSSNKDLFPSRKEQTFGIRISEELQLYETVSPPMQFQHNNNTSSLCLYVFGQICIVKNHEEYKERLYKLYLVFVSVPTVVCNVVTFKKSFFYCMKKNYS